MKYSLAFSPCPNDTFITGALVEKKISTLAEYSVHIADVEELNRASENAVYDITKLSFHAYALCADQYSILPVGAALGFGNGPLIISKRKIFPDEIPFVKLAAPGKNTTATMLAGFFFGKELKISHYLFSDIEDVILSGECDAGIIIHETRFTYQNKGLKKICDMGEMWEKETALPLPLGCFVIRNSIAAEIQKRIIADFSDSLDYAQKFPDSLSAFILKHSQINDKNITQQHIDLYVNEFSKDLGETGRKAIHTLFEKAKEKGIIPDVRPVIL